MNSQGIIDTPGEAKKAGVLKEELASLNLTREKLDAMMKEFVDTAQVASEKDTYMMLHVAPKTSVEMPPSEGHLCGAWMAQVKLCGLQDWVEHPLQDSTEGAGRRPQGRHCGQCRPSPVHLKPFDLFVCGHSMFTGEPCAPWLGRI